MDVHFRPYAESDLRELQRIRAAAFRPVFVSFRRIVGPDIAAVAFPRADAEQAKLLDDVCRSAGAPHHVVVVELGTAIAGFVSYTIDAAGRMGEIGLNAVDPAHAGRGVGAAMYEHVLARMKDAGVEVATVGTGGDPSHAPARRAYEKVGFGPSIPSVTLYKRL
jgi:GNAT superfamily N-acetyltransferase